MKTRAGFGAVVPLLAAAIVCCALVPNLASANEVFGCGGFIKNAKSDLDFSKVEVGLYNPQGSLKIKTDCSPSNGYYFIPLYDKGEYLLKVIPPPGWSFEPEQVAIKFDGKTDVCSQGKDVNFIFKGFGITGKVEIYGHSVGAKGVQVELRSESNTKIGQTFTDSNGIFSFTPIKSGRYVIRVKHDKWHFVNAEYAVTVTTGNTEIPEKSLVVSGFDVEGNVHSDGQPFGNVGFLLYPEKGAKPVLKCSSGGNVPAVTGTHPKYSETAQCYVEANKATGSFVFAGVSSGKYRVVPVFNNKAIKFHIKPEAMEIVVGRDSLKLSESFEVTGFSVGGRVLLAAGGPGVANAKVKLNGKEVATTGSDGSYMLDNIQAGTYTIQVSAEDVQFKDHIAKISLSNPALPDVIVSGFKVCGQVISKASHRVAITKKGSTFHIEVPTKEHSAGEWCTYLEVGHYTVEVMTTDAEKAAGIQFFPLTQSIHVDRSPQSGIIFSQLRATVSGEVRCLPDADNSCTKDVTVTLTPLDSNGHPTGQAIIAEPQAGQYSFANVLPGSYEVSVPKGKLCWESNTVRINVKTAQETVPPIVQSGYIVSIVSSHDTKMTYKQKGVEGAKSDEMTLNPGMNTFCVKKAGSYEISLTGCHQYGDNVPKTFSTSDLTPTTITAQRHRHTVKILAEERSTYKTTVTSSSGTTETIEFRPTEERSEGAYVYQHHFFLEPASKLTLTPISDIMLFTPTTLEVTGSSDCTEVPTRIRARKGLLIDGKTNPPIKDAKITLLFPNNVELSPLVTQTNEQGEFRFGPIDASLAVELSAEKESYVFSAFDKASGTFSGHKLCEIIVTVKDDAGNRLPGVLLSLSGAESYRKNLVTGEDGTIKFHSLSPSEYYLRAMMKEYDFKPNSKLIQVADGATVVEELRGTRTAFSVFGTITSLNGEPFSNVAVEAVSDDRCGNHLEESTSEINGQYRIRGLQPGCQYRVRVRTDAPNSNVDRSIPKEKIINVEKGDIRDVNMIAISPLAFVDVTVRVLASENDYYKTLKIFLYKKGSDSPVHSQRIESPLNPKSKINPGIMVFFPRIPFDGKTYYIELTSTLSDKSYKYSLPTVQFTANSSSFFTEMHFRPELRTAESDLNQNSLSAIVLIFIVGFIFFKQDLALELLSTVWGKLGSGLGDLLSKSSKPKEQRYEPVAFDEKEIDKLASSINAIKKKKPKKVN